MRPQRDEKIQRRRTRGDGFMQFADDHRYGAGAGMIGDDYQNSLPVRAHLLGRGGDDPTNLIVAQYSVNVSLSDYVHN